MQAELWKLPAVGAHHRQYGLRAIAVPRTDTRGTSLSSSEAVCGFGAPRAFPSSGGLSRLPGRAGSFMDVPIVSSTLLPWSGGSSGPPARSVSPVPSPTCLMLCSKEIVALWPTASPLALMAVRLWVLEGPGMSSAHLLSC